MGKQTPIMLLRGYPRDAATRDMELLKLLLDAGAYDDKDRANEKEMNENASDMSWAHQRHLAHLDWEPPALPENVFNFFQSDAAQLLENAFLGAEPFTSSSILSPAVSLNRRWAWLGA